MLGMKSGCYVTMWMCSFWGLHVCAYVCTCVCKHVSKCVSLVHTVPQSFADLLNQNAGYFQKTATNLKRKLWWQNVKVCLCSSISVQLYSMAFDHPNVQLLNMDSCNSTAEDRVTGKRTCDRARTWDLHSVAEFQPCEPPIPVEILRPNRPLFLFPLSPCPSELWSYNYP